MPGQVLGCLICGVCAWLPQTTISCIDFKACFWRLVYKDIWHLQLWGDTCSNNYRISISFPGLPYLLILSGATSHHPKPALVEVISGWCFFPKQEKWIVQNKEIESGFSSEPRVLPWASVWLIALDPTFLLLTPLGARFFIPPATSQAPMTKTVTSISSLFVFF